MWLRYYMDVHVPAAISEALRRRGIDVLTSQQDGTREATDEVLLERAAELDRVLYSQDRDMLRIAHARQAACEPFPGLVFSHQRGTSSCRVIWSVDETSRLCPRAPWELDQRALGGKNRQCGTAPCKNEMSTRWMAEGRREGTASVRSHHTYVGVLESGPPLAPKD